MDLRHTYLAHSGAKKNEDGKCYVTLRSDSSKKAVIGLTVQNLALRLPDFGPLNDFRTILEFLIPKIDADLQAANKYLEDEVRGIPLDDLYAAALQP